MKGPHGKIREALPDAPGWALVKLPRAGRQALVRYRRNGHVMTATDLPGLIECADGKNGYERFRTWVVAQAIRNALQMRALNITIRRAVHEALDQVDMARDAVRRRGSQSLRPEEIAALDFCAFQLGTVRDYMEAPGSAELEEAYQRYVREPDVNR